MSVITYLKSFIQDKDVAAVAPSTRFTIDKVCGKIDFSRDLLIFEYGAGTGEFAQPLLDKMSADSELVLFETNPRFVKELEQMEDSRLTIYDKSVEKVDKLVSDKYYDRVDYIISGIPFSFLEDETKERILRESRKLLKDHGKFLAYQTSEHLKRSLLETFGNVDTSRVWLNVPPMVVYESEK
jgi:phosphatidylethanolamine/phosphatidyl-N-methylethanolamine N-methyltransferase